MKYIDIRNLHGGYQLSINEIVVEFHIFPSIVINIVLVVWHWTITRLFPFFPAYHYDGRV